MTFSEDLFWGDVAGDHERDLHTAALTHGKVAVAGYWPFLSSAYSEQDFENRLSLSLSRISSLVAPEVLEDVVSSLRDDYRVVTGASDNPYSTGEKKACPSCNQWGKFRDGETCDDCNGKGYLTHDDPARKRLYGREGSKVAEKGGKPWDKDDDDDTKDESDAAKDQAEDETGTDNDSDKSDSDGDEDDTQSGKGKSESDDDGDDKSKGNQPNWLNKSDRDKSHTDKSDKAKKESGLSVPDGGAEVAASSYAGPWHHPGGSKSYAQGYLHGKNDVLPVYTGDEDYLMGHRDGRSAKTSTYVPDPSNAGRYQYQNLESLPLNNGDLQGPDGFVQDLAEGEQRTPEAYARQTTPGTWSQGEGMPERPMPQGVQRGYQPVASMDDPKERERHYLRGYSDAVSSDGDQRNFQPGRGEAKVHYSQGWQDGHTELDARRNYKKNNVYQPVASYKDIDKNGCPDCGAKWKDGKLQHAKDCPGLKEFDPFHESSLKTAHLSPMMFDKDGFLITALVDPQLGAPLNANPYYFADGSQGLAGDATFPTDPWGGNVPDRANEYGDVQPGVSSGSEEGYSDGKGYSRSQPGTQASLGSPNFTRLSIAGSKPYQLGWSHTIHNERKDNPYVEGSLEHQAYEHGYAGRNEDGSEKPRQSNSDGGAENYNAGYWKRGSTDGKIVGSCSGCGDALRVHTTMHGSEYHHLQNDHVRCHGPKVAARWGSDTEGRGESYSFNDALTFSQQNYGTHFDKEGYLVEAADYVSRPDALDPTGRGDDWSARTWDAGANTRPMQSHQDRGVNTPVRPPEPLRTRNIGAENPQFDRNRTDSIQMSGDEDEE